MCTDAVSTSQEKAGVLFGVLFVASNSINYTTQLEQRERNLSLTVPGTVPSAVKYNINTVKALTHSPHY